MPLTATANPDEFAATLPEITGDGVAVEYYVEATDEFGNTGTTPRSAPDVLYTFEVASQFD